MKISGLISLLLVACLTTYSRADSIRLPLHGYYHPGRYMPVQWNVSPDGASLQIRGGGCVTTVVGQPQPDGTAPLLPLERLTTPLTWQTSAASGQIEVSELRALSADERLVAYDGDDHAIATQLFPDQTVVLIHLDSADAVLHNGVAWESLDGVIFQAATWDRISDEDKMQLFAEGVVIAVLGDREPYARWQWSHRGGAWVGGGGMVTPQPVMDGVYEPTYAWQPGKSSQFRSTVVLLGVLVCIVIAGAALWRSRWMAVAQIIVAGAAVALLISWNEGQFTVNGIQGAVWVVRQPISIVDQWHFELSRRDAEFHVGVSGAAHPIFYDENQLAAEDLQVECTSEGTLHEVSGSLKAKWPLAIVDRGARRELPSPTQPINTPLRALPVRLLYPGLDMVGQYQANDKAPPVWAGLVLR